MEKEQNTLTKIARIAKTTFENFREDDCPARAAAISFYAVTALPPLLVIFASIISLIYDSNLAIAQLAAEVESLFGPSSAELVEEILKSQQGSSHGLAATFGGLTLLFSASALFGQLQSAINHAWEVEVKEDASWLVTVRKRLLSMAAVLGAAFLLLISLVFSTLVTALGDRVSAVFGLNVGLVQLLQISVTALMVAAIFSLIYRFLPDARVSWEHALKSGLLTSVVFLAGKLAFGFYLGNSDPGASYGSAASLVLFLFWVFYSSNILLLGAELTEVLARADGEKLRPKKYAEKR